MLASTCPVGKLPILKLLSGIPRDVGGPPLEAEPGLILLGEVIDRWELPKSSFKPFLLAGNEMCEIIIQVFIKYKKWQSTYFTWYGIFNIYAHNKLWWLPANTIQKMVN